MAVGINTDGGTTALGGGGGTTALGGGGGIMNDDISSDVKTTLDRFSSGRPSPEVCSKGGGGMVIVAKNDSRSRLMRFVWFLNPLSSTESILYRKSRLVQT